MFQFNENCALESYCQIFNGLVLPFRMGAFSYIHGIAAIHVLIGRYCCIADGVVWGGEAHPTDWVSSFPLTYDKNPLPALTDFCATHGVTVPQEPFDSSVRPIHVGNDVWIGQGVFIGSGVRIGDGAVIAARAVVTKDVPPYAIVGGTPAQVIRMRFPEDVVARLLRSEWWRYSPADFAPMGMSDPLAFLDRFEARMADDPLQPIHFGVTTGQEMIDAVRGGAVA